VVLRGDCLDVETGAYLDDVDDEHHNACSLDSRSQQLDDVGVGIDDCDDRLRR
jgi:hypothetical protein